MYLSKRSVLTATRTHLWLGSLAPAQVYHRSNYLVCSSARGLSAGEQSESWGGLDLLCPPGLARRAVCCVPALSGNGEPFVGSAATLSQGPASCFGWTGHAEHSGNRCAGPGDASRWPANYHVVDDRRCQPGRGTVP